MVGRALFALVLMAIGTSTLGQEASLHLLVLDGTTHAPLSGVSVWTEAPRHILQSTNGKGKTHFEGLETATWTLTCIHAGYASHSWQVSLEGGVVSDTLRLQPLKLDLGVAQVEARANPLHLPSISAGAIFSGMKSHLVRPLERGSDLSQARQVYAKIPGLNIWESDGAGIQLGIGGRGLSPNRTSHFNVRQNGFDISADPLGYPESYYTPPLEAVDLIEVVRGAGAMQYGTQFGGLINFKMKQASGQDSLQLRLGQRLGSFGDSDSLLAAYTSTAALSVIRPRGLRAFVFYQRKQGTGWRPNSGYLVHTVHANAQLAKNNHAWNLEFTHMNYLAKQSGGLLDIQFERDPRASYRNRNWFGVNWNLAALHHAYRFSPLTQWRTTVFGLRAERKALGFLGAAGRLDHADQPRDLIWGRFRNAGVESRLMHRVLIKDRMAVLLGGVRAFYGNTNAKQGQAPTGHAADFSLTDPTTFAGSDYTLPNLNIAVFTQAIVPLTDNLNLTPGLRWEWINTQASGQILQTVVNGAGTIIDDTTFTDSRNRTRHFLLGGIGLSWKPSPHLEIYANAVQNYRAINFSDIQVQGLSVVVDPEISDERGANIDLGFRGELAEGVHIDISGFVLIYRDRIGAYNTKIPDPILVERIVRFRTNIADANIAGIEALLDLSHRFGKIKVDGFVNAAFTRGRYHSATEAAFDGRLVELVPAVNSKVGLGIRRERWHAHAQLSYTSEQFSDATNAVQTPGAVDGVIPAYNVLDLGLNWKAQHFEIGLNINNVLDARYFTRRASGYPGPGIIPSDGRMVALSVWYTL